MKKLLALFLVCIMALSLVACGGDAEPATTTEPAASTPDATDPAASGATQVGFGSGNITPDWPVSLMGYGNEATRISTGKKTDIYILCVAFTDAEGETILVMSLDSGSGGGEKYVRPAVSEATGIPTDHILVSSIHQHSTPTFTQKYVNLLEQKSVEAAQQALDDRAPAKMYINKVETVAMSFVRNYIANDPAGSIVGDNYNDSIGAQYGYKCHESEADNEMRLIKFEREGKRDIIMVNFQAHPHMGAGSADTNVHGDWPAVMRDLVSEKLDADCIYFSGAGGNMNSTSRISEENISTDFKDHGRRAANYISKAEKTYVEAELGDVKVMSQTNAYENDHSMDHLGAIATELHNMRATNFEAAKAAVNNYPEIHSIYHASSIVDKIKAGPTRELTIGAFAIGDVVFTYHPYEMFDTNGMELRNGTVGNENYLPEEQLENPYEMTFICTIANGHLGYVPSQLGYDNGGYSTDIAYLAPGSGERLVGDYLQILNELHG